MQEKETLELSIIIDECSLKTDGYRDTSTFYRLHFCTINEKGEVRNCSSSFGSEPFAGFDNLVVRLWISWAYDKFTADNWEVLYNSLYSVALREAELHVKTLKRIGKICSAMVVRPTTFGQFVALVAQGVGIKRFARVEGRSGSWHTDTRYSFHPLTSLAEAVDQRIETARRLLAKRIRERARHPARRSYPDSRRRGAQTSGSARPRRRSVRQSCTRSVRDRRRVRDR
jgi:hypothetical protein